MNPDELHIEFRKVGGAFVDETKESFALEEWAVFMCRPSTNDEFILSAGSKKDSMNAAKARISHVLAKLNELTDEN
jgi:hypothetical protein